MVNDDKTKEKIIEIRKLNVNTLYTISKELNAMIETPNIYSEDDFKKFYITSEIMNNMDFMDTLSLEDDVCHCELKRVHDVAEEYSNCKNT